eukprot:g1940.t1
MMASESGASVQAFDAAGGSKKGREGRANSRRAAEASTKGKTKANAQGKGKGKGKGKGSNKKNEKNRKTGGKKEAASSSSSSGSKARSTGVSGHVFTVEHSLTGLGEEHFQPRGSISVKFSKASRQIRVKVDMSSEFSESESESFLALAAAGKYYRLRLPVLSSALDDGKEPVRHVIASIPACQLLIGKFQEQIWLNLEMSGALVGVDYTTPSIEARACDEEALRSALRSARKHPIRFQTSASAKSMPKRQKPLKMTGLPPAAPPPGMEHLRQAAKGKDGKPIEQQSFLRKYWYYILPVVLLMSMGGGGK